MSYSADSLFLIVMKFLVKNIFQVESFVGFPSLVGEEIFKRFVNECDVNEDILLHDILKKFVAAYENMVLERLNLSKQLLILNEYFESIVSLSRFITQLCVCDCFLGANHEIYRHILRCERLKTLCLRNNSMDDSAVRVLTLQTRMYGVGGKNVENLDLSGNDLSDKMIPWMCAFPKLSFLNLSGSNITEKGVNILAKQYNLKQIFDREQHKEVTTTGWAAALLDKWIEKMTLSKKNRKILKPTLRKISLTLCPSPSASRKVPFLFQKFSQELTTSSSFPPVTKSKGFSVCNDKEIEDLFSQYI